MNVLTAADWATSTEVAVTRIDADAFVEVVRFEDRGTYGVRDHADAFAEVATLAEAQELADEFEATIREQDGEA